MSFPKVVWIKGDIEKIGTCVTYFSTSLDVIISTEAEQLHVFIKLFLFGVNQSIQHSSYSFQIVLDVNVFDQVDVVSHSSDLW